jgi:hypothetical protein
MRGGERAYIFEQCTTHFGDGHYILWDEFLRIYAKILDPSDDDRAWAYNLLDRIVNPNVVLTIIDWLQFFEEVLIREEASYIFERRDIDVFDDVVYRDGRVLRDGHTILNAKMNVLRNGLFKRDGSIDRSGAYSIPDSNIVRLPIRRGYRMRDDFNAALGKVLTDRQTAKLLQNNLIKRDGSSQRRGWIETAFDAIPPLSLYLAETEGVELHDTYSTVVKKVMSDTHINSVKRDGTHPRDGMSQRASVLDIFIFIARYAPTDFEDTVDIGEGFSAGMRYHHFRNGIYKRDGTIPRNSMMLISLE